MYAEIFYSISAVRILKRYGIPTYPQNMKPVENIFQPYTINGSMNSVGSNDAVLYLKATLGSESSL